VKAESLGRILAQINFRSSMFKVLHKPYSYKGSSCGRRRLIKKAYLRIQLRFAHFGNSVHDKCMSAEVLAKLFHFKKIRWLR
jgi:hypothetical protein